MEESALSTSTTPAPDVHTGPALLVVNTGARSGLAAFERVQGLLAARGVDVAQSVAVRRPAALPRLLREALAHGVGRVLVGGGDGTQALAANTLAGRDVTLGVLPLGTGNDFARSLGIPADLERACDVVAQGYSVRIDVGRVKDRAFLNAASLGLSAAICRRLTGAFKARAGRLAYPVAAAAELLEHRPFHVRLVVDAGEVREHDVLQLVVGNGRYHGAGNVTTPDAALDDRRLDAYAVLAPSREQHAGAREDTALGRLEDLATLAAIGLRLRRGEHVEHPSVVSFTCRALEVQAEPAQDVNADGELVGKTPVRFEVWPAALRVLVPAPH